MCTIQLADIIRQGNDLTDAGSLFYERTKEAFDSSSDIVVDMEGVTALPSILLNVSIGRIIDEYGVPRLKSGMSFRHISRSQAERLQEYIKKFENK